MAKKVWKNKRIRRIRAKIQGTAARPRLTIFRSLQNIYAQIIDDAKGNTVVAFDSRQIKGGKSDLGTAEKVGAEIAKLAALKKIKEVVFDRRGYKYHGRVKALAEAARKGGLKF